MRAFLFVSFLGFFDTVMSGPFTENPPLLWRNTRVPVAFGEMDYNMSIVILSACKAITNETVYYRYVDSTTAACDEMYQTLFLERLQKMFPEKRRWTRGLPIVVGAAAGTVMVSMQMVTMAGLGIAFYQISQLDGRISKLEEVVRLQEMEANKVREAVNTLQLEVQKLTNKTLEQGEILSMNIKSTFTLSAITARLEIAGLVFPEATRKLKEGKLNAPFFDFMGIELPCGDECPWEYGKYIQGSLSGINLHLIVRLPRVNREYHIVQADPMDLIKEIGNQTCVFKYNGPRNALISNKTDCIHDLNVNYNQVYYAPSTECLNEAQFTNFSNLYILEKCLATEHFPYERFVQLKDYHNNLLIYCPGSRVAIGDEERPCPDYAFTFPMTSTFRIGNRVYRGGTYQLPVQQSTDPFFTVKINWKLHPSWNISDIIPNVVHLDPISVEGGDGIFSNSGHGFFIILGVVLGGFIIMGAAIGVCYCRLSKKQRRDHRVYYSNGSDDAPSAPRGIPRYPN